MNKLLASLLLSGLLANVTSGAQASNITPSEASAFSVLGSVLVVGGSMQSLASSGEVVVESVSRMGESTVVVLKNLSDGARATVELSGKAAANLSLGVGKAITVTATASGHVLSAAGEIIAFVPNEIGKALLHHSRTGE